MKKSFSAACGAISYANTALTVGINSKLSNSDLEASVITVALQNVCNIGNDNLFKAVSAINPDYKPFTSDPMKPDTMLDMAIMMIAMEVVKDVYAINNNFPSEERNRELSPSMPLNLEDIWRNTTFVRHLRTKKKKGDDM
jgi:hypothetical protein